MGKTAIGWTDETWNPVRGCSRVSEGCRNCYAEQQAARIVRMGKGKPTVYDELVKFVGGHPRWTGEIALDARRLAAPLGWRAPRRVFVDSMSDLFFDRRPDDHIAAVFGVMAATQHITYQILTKYAARMRAWFGWVASLRTPLATIERSPILSCTVEAQELLGKRWTVADPHLWPLPNVWLGVSVENQDAADERIPHLLATPAAVRFLSCEPLLGPVDLRLPRAELEHGGPDAELRCSRCGLEWPLLADTEERHECPPGFGHSLDWVIDGCESGDGARPAQREWFASIEEQCHAAGVAYFHKQEMIDGKLVHDFPGWQEFPRG